MSCNLIKEYVDFTKSSFATYTKTIMDKYYDETIFNKYLDKYISIRYYNEEPEVRATLEYNLNHYLGKIYEKNPSIISEFIQKLFVLYYYLDNVVDFDIQNQLKDFVELIKTIREEKVGIKDENFTKEFTSLLANNHKRKEEFLKAFDTHEFYLEINKTSIKDLYNITLKYEIEIPKLYSKYAINKIWKTELISENKLKIEYYLLNQLILKDIINGDFHKKYLVDIKDSLFNKTDKLKNILDIFNNDISKDLITIKITYNNFLTNKEIIYSLIKEGYEFAVVLDEKYTNSNDNTTILDNFKYIIAPNEEYITSSLKERKNLIRLE